MNHQVWIDGFKSFRNGNFETGDGSSYCFTNISQGLPPKAQPRGKPLAARRMPCCANPVFRARKPLPLCPPRQLLPADGLWFFKIENDDRMVTIDGF